MKSTIKIQLLTDEESIATFIENKLNKFNSINVSLDVVIYPKKKYNLIITCFKELTPLEYVTIGKFIGYIDKSLF